MTNKLRQFLNGGHLGSAIWNLLISPLPLKFAKDDKKVTEINNHENDITM